MSTFGKCKSSKCDQLATHAVGADKKFCAFHRDQWRYEVMADGGTDPWPELPPLNQKNTTHHTTCLTCMKVFLGPRTNEKQCMQCKNKANSVNEDTFSPPHSQCIRCEKFFVDEKRNEVYCKPCYGRETPSVNHPPHYAHPSGVECIAITEHMNFCLGNAIKYIWRADSKGNAVEDLQKARWYIEREIARREQK